MNGTQPQRNINIANSKIHLLAHDFSNLGLQSNTPKVSRKTLCVETWASPHFQSTTQLGFPTSLSPKKNISVDPGLPHSLQKSSQASQQATRITRPVATLIFNSSTANVPPVLSNLFTLCCQGAFPSLGMAFPSASWLEGGRHSPRLTWHLWQRAPFSPVPPAPSERKEIKLGISLRDKVEWSCYKDGKSRQDMRQNPNATCLCLIWAARPVVP